MARKIKWRGLIQRQTDKVFVYLTETYGATEAARFIEELVALAESLAKNPGMGARSEADQFSFPIRMYRLHYRFDQEVLELVYLQDMRSNKEMIDII